MKAIAIDFDGVVHRYSDGWKDGSIYDVPVPGAFQNIRTLLDIGYAVFIHTTRKPKQVKRWMLEQQGYVTYIQRGGSTGHSRMLMPVQVIPKRTRFWNKAGVIGVTNRKLPAIVYVDDRAYRFEKGNPQSLVTPWYKAMVELKTILEGEENANKS